MIMKYFYLFFTAVSAILKLKIFIPVKYDVQKRKDTRIIVIVLEKGM